MTLIDVFFLIGVAAGCVVIWHHGCMYGKIKGYREALQELVWVEDPDDPEPEEHPEPEQRVTLKVVGGKKQ